jgi:hypothetical protein
MNLLMCNYILRGVILRIAEEILIELHEIMYDYCFDDANIPFHR